MDINKDYSKSEIMEAKKNYRGWVESDEINKWLSLIFQSEVILMRAMPERRMGLDNARLPNSLESDRRRGFLSDAAVHLVNRTSVEAFRNNVKSKYKDDPDQFNQIYLDERIFRPSFVIETEAPYEEEEFQEMRINNIMWRNIGPCIRCKSIQLNWDSHERNELSEPYMSLFKYRKEPSLGPIFGVYYQPDVIRSQADFETLLPGYKLKEETIHTINQESSLVTIGDTFMVRRKARLYQVEKPSD